MLTVSAAQRFPASSRWHSGHHGLVERICPVSGVYPDGKHRVFGKSEITDRLDVRIAGT